MNVKALCNPHIIPRINYYYKLHDLILKRSNHNLAKCNNQIADEEDVELKCNLEAPVIAVPSSHNNATSFLLSSQLLHHQNANNQMLFIPPSSSSTSLGKKLSEIIGQRLSETPTVVIELPIVDLIGPPDPVSKLRPIVRSRLSNETLSQRRLRDFQDETQRWNEQFWYDHNSKFMNERDRYIKTRLKEDSKTVLSSEEMSEFYKAFLDRHWKTHVSYNFEWYRRNVKAVLMALVVCLDYKRYL